VIIDKHQMGYVGGIGFVRNLGKMKFGTALRYYQSAKVRTDPGYHWDLSRLSLSFIFRIR
jgi:hypothetical protein